MMVSSSKSLFIDNKFHACSVMNLKLHATDMGKTKKLIRIMTGGSPAQDSSNF